MSLKDYTRGYVDCRNDHDNLFTKKVYEALVECVGLDSGIYNYDRFDNALALLDKGELPSAAFAKFKDYLIENKDEIELLWYGRDRVEEWLADIYDVAEYLGKEHTVEKDIEKIMEFSNGVYIEKDSVSGKQYLKFDGEALSKMFEFSGHSVKTKDENGNLIPEDKQEHRYWKETHKIYAYKDYVNQIYHSHPDVLEKLMKEGNLAELNMVFNNKIDIDYANKTSAFSNCDRFFESGVKEAGILTTLMIAYQDINERLTMLLLNKNHQLDLIMNPNAAHDSKINGHSGADADFQEKDTKNFLELQTKQLKNIDYDKYDPNTLIYKMTKHKSFVKYIEEGKHVYHMEKAQNIQKSLYVNGEYVGRNDKYLQEHYTIYDMNAIIKAIEKHPECIIDDKKYASYNAMAIYVEKLESITGKAFKIEVDKVMEEQREFQKLIDGYIDKAINLQKEAGLEIGVHSQKRDEITPEKPKTLDNTIKDAMSKKENSDIKPPKNNKDKEKER